MTKLDFLSICGDVGISPSIAIENKDVVELLKADKLKPSVNNQLKLSAILKTDF